MTQQTTETTTFTPGPWKADKSFIDGWESEQWVVRAPVPVYATTNVLAIVNTPPKSAASNAHLIASAPDYYAAVELVKSDAGELDGDNAGYVAITIDAYHALLTAHAKAEGRERT